MTTNTTYPTRRSLRAERERARRGRGRAVAERTPLSEMLRLPSSYYPGVDGMRALAILSVLVFHTGLYSNGLFGVDIFFVLSGFLITLTLLREFHRTGRISLRTFYVRRVKRLLPMLLIVLGATLAAVMAFGDPATRERFAAQALASLVYLTNWEQIAAGQQYWEGFGHLNPLGHMWSLAITEQFYLVWPIVVLAVLMIGGRRAPQDVLDAARASRPAAGALRAWLVLAVAVIGYAVASAQPLLRFDGTNSDRLYLGTDTHTMGLLAGAAAAAANYLWLRRRAARPAPLLGTVASVTLGVSITLISAATATLIVILSINADGYDIPWLYQWGFAAVSALAAVLILTLTSRRNLVTHLFALRPLVAIGKVSYTLFLVHMPLLWLITAVEPASMPIDLLILGLPGSLLAAGALHHLVAEPVRLREWGKAGTVRFVSALSAIAVAVAFVPTVLPSLLPATPAGTGSTRVLTLGDSLANDFASALSANLGDRFSVTDGGVPGCAIAGSTAQRTAEGITQEAAGACTPWADRWSQLIERSTPDVIVVNIAWDAVEQQIDGEWTDVTDAEFAAAYREELERMARMLEESGAKVIVANSRLHNAVVTPEQATAFNALLAETLAAHPGIAMFDLNAAVCTVDGCTTATADGAPMYLDDRVHFSEDGKRELAPKLAGAIEAALG